MFSLFSRFKKKEVDIDKSNLPLHIAIIMDGNGRWAKKRGLTRGIGHKEGANTLRKIVRLSDKIGIKYLTVYAFSTENWKRPKKEVDTLMSLLLDYLKNAERELAGSSVRIRVIGDRDMLPIEIQKEILRVEKSTKDYLGLTLNIALNYGSKFEITNAVKEIVKDVKLLKLKIEDIDETTISKKLYTFGTPDPDLIIRPGGEKRISNFLLWQSAYTEFCFSEVLWPDFSESVFLAAIKDYQKRNRRFGGV